MKKLIPLMLVGATAVAFGQNARVDAMGGVTTQGDISEGFHNAAYLVPYLNSAQMSTDQDGDFNFIATKTIGDKMFIGASLSEDGNVITVQDTGDVYVHNFFSDAKTWHNSGTWDINTDTWIPGTRSILPTDEFNAIPNLIIGAKLSSTLAVGAEIYYDANKVKNEETKQIADPNNLSSTIETESVTKESISNKGIILSAVVGDEFKIAPRVGIGFPRNSLTIEHSGGGATIDSTYETNNAIAITAGADLVWPVNDLEMKASVDWTMEKYQFTQTVPGIDPVSFNSVDITTDGNTKVANNFSILYGVTGTLKDDLLWVAEYRGDYLIGREKQEVKDTDIKNTYDHSSMQNEFALGFERPVDGFFIFDELTPRAGFQYTGGKGYYSTEGKGKGNEITYNAKGNYSDGVALTTGFGLEKGRATIDLALEFGEWEGAISGPSAGSATLTVDFGKDSAAASSSNEGNGNW